MSDEPLSHVRRAVPPWSSLSITECGRATSEMAKVITAEEARALVNRHGQQRAAFLLCMTCSHKITPTWEVDPISTLSQHLTRVGWSRNADDRNAMTRELQAIAALIGAHQDEFDGYVAGLAEATPLAERRAAKRAQRAYRGQAG